MGAFGGRGETGEGVEEGGFLLGGLGEVVWVYGELGKLDVWMGFVESVMEVDDFLGCAGESEIVCGCCGVEV